MNDKFKFHVAGEGGEYETIVTDSSRYTHGRIEITEREIVEEGEEGYVVVKGFEVVRKIEGEEVEVVNVCLEEEMEDCDDIQVDLVDKTVERGATEMGEVKSTMSKSGLFVTSSITSLVNSGEIQTQALSIFEQLTNILKSRGLKPSDVFNVHLYLKDIGDFAKINVIYKEYFGTYLPPSRTCIGTGKFMDEGNDDCYKLVQLDVNAQKRNNSNGKYELYNNVECLHVQSISTWAPVCVGPYSQCGIVRGGLMYLAGNIGLVPETMKIVEGGWEKELTLCFKNVASVLDSLNSELKNCFGVLVYVAKDAVEEGGESCFSVIRRVVKEQVQCNGTIVKGQAEGLNEEEEEGEKWDGYEDEETWLAMTGGAKEQSDDVEKEGGDFDLPVSIVFVKDLPVGASIEIEVLNGTEKLSRLGFETKKVRLLFVDLCFSYSF
ncbi:hypothetical protein TL16_g07806 [Triparma laevis f. inornata]|uniref:Diphthamide synthase domain-containing protein n=1 Tax=Triparma laevis f. inornata TaxID=1714386 RepID=A0A9W7EHU2_9STRA|nr:hypothetical protein TL16_g07806 [Triparma laevis f. inornata]